MNHPRPATWIVPAAAIASWGASCLLTAALSVQGGWAQVSACLAAADDPAAAAGRLVAAALAAGVAGWLMLGSPRAAAQGRAEAVSADTGEPDSAPVDAMVLFASLMEHTPDRIYFKDAKGRFLHVNRAQAEAFGLQPADMVGKTDWDIHSGPCRQCTSLAWG